MFSTATIFGGGNTALKTATIPTTKGIDLSLNAFPNIDKHNQKQPFLTCGHSA